MTNDNAQTLNKRPIVDSLDRVFARLYVELAELIRSAPADQLYADTGSSSSRNSIASGVLRSAGVIEQTFGGITANLWDDPFEWTLPEYLSTPEKLLAYLSEVEATRRRAFLRFADDGCLLQLISTPSGTRPLVDLLLETLTRAAAYHGVASPH